MSSDERAVLIAETFRKIHDQPASRDYSVAEVKQIVYPLIDALEASAQAPAVVDVEKATSRHFGSALSRFVDSFNGDEAGDIDYMEASDGATGWAMRGGNDVEAVFGKAVTAVIASDILQDAAELIEQGRKQGHVEALAAVKGAMEFRAIREGRA